MTVTEAINEIKALSERMEQVSFKYEHVMCHTDGAYERMGILVFFHNDSRYLKRLSTISNDVTTVNDKDNYSLEHLTAVTKLKVQEALRQAQVPDRKDVEEIQL